MEVGQRLFVIEPVGLGNKTIDELQDAVGAIGKALEKLLAVDAFARFSLVEPAFRAGRILGGRHPDEGQIIEALEMGALFLELLAALNIDECGDRCPETGCGDSFGPEPGSPRRRSPSRSRIGASALLSRAVVPTSSAGVALSRSGPRNRAVR